MEPISPRIRLMTNEELYQSQQSSLGLIFDYKGKSYVLSAGLSDRVHVFTRSVCILVLTINKSYGYIGLDAYMPSEPEAINTIVLHSEYQIKEALGCNWNLLSPRAMTQRLMGYLI